MKIEDVQFAEARAREFLAACKAFHARAAREGWPKGNHIIGASKESASVKRCSMELTRALTGVRARWEASK